MWRYYQTREKGPWQSIKDSPRVFDEAKEVGAKRMTILATSNNLNGSGVESEQELEELRRSCKYKGPLYFDIDNKNDLGEAIQSARTLLKRLKSMGLAGAAVRVYCSGSKGMHLIVDSRAFSNGRSIRHLPLVYKEMAKDLHVLGMDFQVYSEGRGVCWRLPNQQRDDGKYRIEISEEELQSLTPEVYQQLVTAPRPELPYLNNFSQSVDLVTLFERARKRVAERPKRVTPLADDQLIPITQAVPACIEQLALGKVRESVNFNQAAIQLAIYGARTGQEDEAYRSLASRMASATHSSQYSSERERRDHLLGLYGYVAHTSRYVFSCQPLRSILKSYPCEGCPIHEGIQQSLEDELEIFSMEKGYAVGARDAPRIITNFTLRAEEAMYEVPQDGSDERRTGLRMVASCHTGQEHKFLASEEIWGSKAKFMSQIQGYSDMTFLGSDLDVQRLKGLILSKEEEMGKITKVHTSGVIFDKVMNKLVAVYVEDGASVNHLKVGGTHTLVDVVNPIPTVLASPNAEAADQGLDETLTDLLNSNSPEAVALMAGWFCACHLKQHIGYVFHQFPLLSLWGAAGSGKTESATMYLTLNGVSYHSTGGSTAFSVPGMTKFTLLQTCSTTSTIPRLLDEYNPAGMAPAEYNYAGEVMKSAWSGQVMTRGALNSNSNVSGRTGARVVEIEISSPIVLMSEQAPAKPALQQRAISVYLTRTNRDGCTEPFKRAKKHSDRLIPLAKALMQKALTKSPAEVRNKVDSYVDRLSLKIDDRPKFSYSVIQYGLEFLQEVCEELELTSAGKVQELRDGLALALSDQSTALYSDSTSSEIDLVMAEVMTMIDLTTSGIEKSIVDGVHYAVMGDSLRLAPTFHAAYSRHYRKTGRTPVIDRLDQFDVLVQQEPYFVASNVMDVLLQVECTQLSIKKMRDKGINTSRIQVKG